MNFQSEVSQRYSETLKNYHICQNLIKKWRKSWFNCYFSADSGYPKIRFHVPNLSRALGTHTITKFGRTIMYFSSYSIRDIAFWSIFWREIYVLHILWSFQQAWVICNKLKYRLFQALKPKKNGKFMRREIRDYIC